MFSLNAYIVHISLPDCWQQRWSVALCSRGKHIFIVLTYKRSEPKTIWFFVTYEDVHCGNCYYTYTYQSLKWQHAGLLLSTPRCNTLECFTPSLYIYNFLPHKQIYIQLPTSLNRTFVPEKLLGKTLPLHLLVVLYIQKVFFHCFGASHLDSQ